jgi:drug/metabolite transporter (DMT)-like permease
MSTAAAVANSSQPSRGRLWGAFAVVYLVWGSTFLGIRVAVETLPPLTMAAVRFLVAGAVLLLVARRGLPQVTARQWRNAAAIGTLFFLGNHGLVSSAARYIPSSLSCLIIAGEVPVIAVLSSLLLPHQPLTRRSLIGAAIGISGVVSLFAGHGFVAGPSQLVPCLMVFGASICWALGAVVSQRLELPRDPVLSAGMQMLCGATLLCGASALRGEPASLTAAALSHRSLFALAYLIVFGSVIAFACYTWLLKHVRA